MVLFYDYSTVYYFNNKLFPELPLAFDFSELLTFDDGMINLIYDYF